MSGYKYYPNRYPYSIYERKRYSTVTNMGYIELNFPIGQPENINGYKKIVESTSTQGTREITNFYLDLNASIVKKSDIPEESYYAIGNVVYWALIYIPSGGDPPNLNDPDDEEKMTLYDPICNIVMSGVIEIGQPTQTVFSRKPLFLFSGDSLYLCVLGYMNHGLTSEITVDINARLQFDVSF